MRWRRNTELDGRLPRQVMSAWPRNTPLAMLHTNPSGDSGRWSVLGVPRGHLEAAATHGTWRGPDKPELAGAASRCALAAIEAIDGQRATIDAPEGAPPFAGWIACLHYELGEILEPAVRGDVGGGTTALLSMLWCPDALLHDRVSGQWWSTGSPPKPAMTSLLGEEMLTTTPPTSTPSAADWPAAVARGVEYIRAGDIFQVNLTRQLTVDVCGDTRHFAHAALGEPQTAYGAFLEFPNSDRSVISLSPELFLSVDADGIMTSRPIKGTLPSTRPASELWASTKDAAELHMIVDLMRNDLGRICEMGSVRVTCPRRVDTHPTVHHGVAEIVGRLRGDVSLVQLLAATFPAGSITGAPKIRAMQIARELEPVPRGLYCGAVGMLGPGQQATFSVAIRTAVIADGTLSYGVGCGIVSDSDPLAELAESNAKAEVLWKTLSPPCDRPSAAAADPQLLA